MTLKSWVSRSIIARTGSCAPPIGTEAAPSDGRADRQRRQQQRVQPFERRVHRAPQRRPRVHRAQVVLGEDVASHLQPQPHARASTCRRAARAAARDTTTLPAGRCAGRRRPSAPRARSRRRRRCVRRRSSAARASAEQPRDVRHPACRRSTATGTPSQSGPSASGGRDRCAASPSSIAWNMQRRVVDRARHRTDVIERRAQRHDAVGGDLAERRLQAR